MYGLPRLATMLLTSLRNVVKPDRSLTSGEMRLTTCPIGRRLDPIVSLADCTQRNPNRARWAWENQGSQILTCRTSMEPGGIGVSRSRPWVS